MAFRRREASIITNTLADRILVVLSWFTRQLRYIVELRRKLRLVSGIACGNKSYTSFSNEKVCMISDGRLH